MTGESVDLLVVGGGVFGLWAAKRAVEAGLSVALVEKRRIGAGSSGGLLGALTAHAPDRWNAKKQFQLDALLALPDLVSALEQETGLETGYGRIGRLMPIRNDAYRAQIAARAEEAVENWRMAETGLSYAPRDDDAYAGWLAPEAGPKGYLYDGLAARIAPRLYGAALSAWLKPRAQVIEGVGYVEWSGAAVLEDGRCMKAGAVVLALGFEGFPRIEALTGRDVGGGQKGQTALLRLREPLPEDAPLIYDNGVYVVPQGRAHVAVGGANAAEWNDPDAADLDMSGPLEKARALCPRVEGAEIVEQWAGVRPRCWRRDPMVGRLPGAAPLWVSTGGYKIGVGIAHRVADALIDALTGRTPVAPPPESFTVAHHLAE